MGIVYRCRDTLTGECVALKRLYRADASLDPEDAWWFQQEARCLAALGHPAIVRARDFGLLPDATPFLVMDVAPGRSLLSWLEVGAIPWPWPYTVLWSFVDQALAGLAHAHARGIIHGDLKPTNLMLEFREGGGSLPRVYILDLGLASLIRDPVDRRLDGSEPPAPVVRAGAGTPGWMAPEQIRKATPHYGPPTDLYALGSILYHLLSGREPYTGTVEEVLDGHRNQPLPDFTPPSNVPPETATFVRKLMAKRPWQRFEYAGDARRAWERLRPRVPVEPWSFRLDPEPNRVEEISSIDGIVRPSQTDRPVAAPTALGLLALRPSPLVARNDERSELGSIVDEMLHPRGRNQKLVLLYGEAGVGKSRLAEWLCEEAHERALMVPLRARYRRIPMPLDGILGAISQHFGLERADRNLVEKTLLNCWEIAKDDEEGRTFVAAAAEWLRPSPPGKVVPVGPTGKRFFFDTPEIRRKTIYRVLAKIGERRPLLLWTDDLHLASDRTFETLTKMRHEMPLLRILVVATVRSEAVAVDSAALTRLEMLRELYGGRVIELRPLTPEHTEELLLSSLPLEQNAIRRAAERARGNPLFALQLLHAWASSGRLTALADGRYRVPTAALEQQPGTTADLWDERLRALPQELRAASYAAAALGGDIPVIVLRALLHSLGFVTSDAIKAMHSAEILIPSGPGRLRWPHALMQEHLLARLMEQSDAKQVFRKAADALALHPAAATRRVVSHRITNLLRAGDEAAVAERVLEFVQNNWRRGRDVAATLHDLARLEGLVAGPGVVAYDRWRAEALRHLGHLGEARRYAERGLAQSIAVGDMRNEAHCLRLLGHILAMQSVPTGREHVLRALAKFAVLEDDAGRAECQLALGDIGHMLGKDDGARTWLKHAWKAFSHLHDALGQGQCLMILGFADLVDSKLDRARQCFDQARSDYEKLGYRLGIAEAEIAYARMAHHTDCFDEAIQRADRALRLMLELRNARGEATCYKLLAVSRFAAGDLAQSQQNALQASALYQQMGEPRGQLEASLVLAQIALLAEAPEARDLVAVCEAFPLVEAESRQVLGLTRAWLAWMEKRLEQARAEIEAARNAYGDIKRAGDQTGDLLTRLSALAWPRELRKAIDDWRSELRLRKRERSRARVRDRHSQSQDPE